MKKIALFLILFVTFFSVKSQDLMNLKPTSFVNDYENIFTPEQKADLVQILSDYEKKTSIEIVVATSADFEFAYKDELGNKWGVGKKGLDNGLLFIVSKAQRHFSARTGYGLEEFLPDATLKTFTHRIFPETLSKGDFYGGIKQLILACQNELGDNGYDFLVRNKKIKELKQAEDFKSGLMNILYIFLFLIVSAGIIWLLVIYYKKLKKREDLNKKIVETLVNIEKLRKLFLTTGGLTKEIEEIYNEREYGVVTEYSLDKNKEVYKELLTHKVVIDSITNTIDNINKSRSDIENYLQDKYTYCEKYLKDELNSILSSINQSYITEGEYNKNKLNKLISIETTLDSKIKVFKYKVDKINNIIDDKDNISKKIEKLRELYADYTKKRNILSTVKIGKRFNSLASVDFDSNITKMSGGILDSFNSLKNNDFNAADRYYTIYITSLSVLMSAFDSINTLFSNYNSSTLFINNNHNRLDSIMIDIDSKINKSGVSYSRKST